MALSRWVSGLSGWVSGLSGRGSVLSGWASGLFGWVSVFAVVIYLPIMSNPCWGPRHSLAGRANSLSRCAG